MDDIKVVDDEKALQIMQKFIDTTPLLDAAQKDKLLAHVQELSKIPGELAKLMNQFQVEYQQAKTAAKYDIIDETVSQLAADPDFDQSKIQKVAETLSTASYDDLTKLPDLIDTSE